MQTEQYNISNKASDKIYNLFNEDLVLIEHKKMIGQGKDIVDSRNQITLFS